MELLEIGKLRQVPARVADPASTQLTVQNDYSIVDVHIQSDNTAIGKCIVTGTLLLCTGGHHYIILVLFIMISDAVFKCGTSPNFKETTEPTALDLRYCHSANR